jgi:hypothetical protein
MKAPTLACDNSELLFLSGRLGIAFVLALVALVAMFLGFKLYSAQRAKRDGTLVKWRELEIHVGSVGASMMILAFAVAYWAYRATPQSYRKTTDATILSIGPEIPDRIPFFISSGLDREILKCEKSDIELRCNKLEEGEACGAPPRVVEGIGRLQIARVGRRTGEVREEVARNLERSLRKFLADRGAKDFWTPRLMSYSSPGEDQTIIRIAFNGVGPEVAGPMCQWLRCEGWTYGPCEMVSLETK